MIIINKLFNLKGRTSIITGASGFLAEKISFILADLGSDLILITRNNKFINNYDTIIKKKYPKIKIRKINCDLSKEKQRKELIKKLNHQKINILINNATFKDNNLVDYASNFKTQSIKKWRDSLEVNLTAVFHLSQGLSNNLIKSGNGSIINVSSIYGLYSPDWSIYKGSKLGNSSAYASAKAGVIQLTKWLSSTLSPKVRVNCISPGGIIRSQPKKFIRAYTKKTSLKRMAKEDDLMGAFAYLASDASSYVTGQNIIIDGGWGN
mgnify:CR=1 FL=1